MTTTTTKPAYDFPTVGCYIDESSGSADDCNSRTIDFAEGYGFTHDPLPPEDDEDFSQILSETADDAVSFLNDCETRTGMHWTFEDNSLFLIADPESAQEQVDFVSTKDQDYPADDYRGEWLHVNDHGNATLYNRVADGRDIEIWAIV